MKTPPWEVHAERSLIARRGHMLRAMFQLQELYDNGSGEAQVGLLNEHHEIEHCAFTGLGAGDGHTCFKRH